MQMEKTFKMIAIGNSTPTTSTTSSIVKRVRLFDNILDNVDSTSANNKSNDDSELVPTREHKTTKSIIKNVYVSFFFFFFFSFFVVVDFHLFFNPSIKNKIQTKTEKKLGRNQRARDRDPSIPRSNMNSFRK